MRRRLHRPPPHLRTTIARNVSLDTPTAMMAEHAASAARRQERFAKDVQAEVDRLLGKSDEINTKVDGLANMSGAAMKLILEQSEKFATQTKASMAEPTRGRSRPASRATCCRSRCRKG